MDQTKTVSVITLAISVLEGTTLHGSVEVTVPLLGVSQGWD